MFLGRLRIARKLIEPHQRSLRGLGSLASGKRVPVKLARVVPDVVPHLGR